MRLIIFALMIFILNGCMSIGGTFFSKNEDVLNGNLIYAGTRLETGYIYSTEGHGITNVPCLVADLPLTIAMDTILLPYSIPKTIFNKSGNENTEIKE